MFFWLSCFNLALKSAKRVVAGVLQSVVFGAPFDVSKSVQPMFQIDLQFCVGSEGFCHMLHMSKPKAGSMMFSWTCHGHVLRTGACPIIPGTKSDGQPFFVNFLLSRVSLTCPYNLMTSLPPVTKNLANHCLIPVQKLSFSNSFFAIATLVYWSKIEKLRCKQKICIANKKLHCNESLILLPPCSPLILTKSHFFHISFFIFHFSYFIFHFSIKLELIELKWANSHNLHSLQQKINQNGWQCPPSDLLLHIPTMSCATATMNEARSRGLVVNVQSKNPSRWWNHKKINWYFNNATETE